MAKLIVNFFEVGGGMRRNNQKRSPPIANAGVGLRYQHHQDFIDLKPKISWVEVHSENYFGGGLPVNYLQRIRENYELSLHGVGLSLGSSERVRKAHIKMVQKLIELVSPIFVSEHLSWNISQNFYLNDLIPVPYTQESLRIFVRNIDEVQNILGRQILIENPSAYFQYSFGDYSETEFLSHLVNQTKCGLLLDINNIYVTCHNQHTDPLAYIKQIPANAIQEIHLAGHTAKLIDDSVILLDDHGSKVADAVWQLYKKAIDIFGIKPTLIEWDSNIPSLDVLIKEAEMANCYLEVQHT